jgi:hypothetical protein
VLLRWVCGMLAVAVACPDSSTGVQSAGVFSSFRSGRSTQGLLCVLLELARKGCWCWVSLALQRRQLGLLQGSFCGFRIAAG